MKKMLVLCLLWSFLFFNCDESYGKLGDADKTATADIPAIMEPMCDLWYSHYGAMRLDGYRIGRWEHFAAEMADKRALFPDLTNHLHDNYAPSPDDYYVFYDDTVYGEDNTGSGGNGGWGFGYVGIVRAVNVFNNDPKTGAIIIEYFDGGYPLWSDDVRNTPLPFFGIFYRVLNADCIQMANAVDLAALYAGEQYYTETATLEEAIAKNTAINDGEFISWGVVIPMDREN
jgi:hypothetical protein